MFEFRKGKKYYSSVEKSTYISKIIVLYNYNYPFNFTRRFGFNLLV